MSKNSQNIYLVTGFTLLWVLIVSVATYSFDLFRDPIAFSLQGCSFEKIGGMAFLAMLIFCLDIAIEMIFSLKNTDTRISQNYPVLALILFVLVGLLVYSAINGLWSPFVLIIGVNWLMGSMKWGCLFVSINKKENDNFQELKEVNLEELK